MGLTFAEKILSLKSKQDFVKPGDILEISPDVLLSHDNTAPIIDLFKEMGGENVVDPDKHTIILDHASPAPSTKHAQNHKKIRTFVKEQGIRNFYDVGKGVCHQVMVEEGLAAPGRIILGSDSHTLHAGVMGAFAAGIGRTEMASIWAVGKIWLKVPSSVRVAVNGKLNPGVYSKDIALYLIGKQGADGGLYKSIEWMGDTVVSMTIEDRAVLTNMMGEMGAKNSFISPDEKTFAYLQNRTKTPYQVVIPDSDANYEMTIEINAADIDAQVACPHTVDNVMSVKDMKKTYIQQAYLGTCTNGRLSDLRIAASILEGKNIHSDVRLIVTPASSQVYLDALNEGLLKILIEAGAMVQSPGCGACMGNHMGIPAEGEVTISTANRNFRGRMGTRNSEIYLANPAVVAASAISGFITDPEMK